MDLLMVVIKIAVIIAMILLMALPFIVEFVTFRRDKDKKITYKRFRIVVYTAVYVIGITVALFLLKEFILWLETLSFIQWIVTNLALSNRTVYFAKVLAAILVNIGIGVLYGFFSKFVRIGLKKKELVKPRKKKGEYDLRQRAERKIIRFFHSETWFFVGSIVKWLSIILSLIYAFIFVCYQVPAMFGASWIPYGFISMLFSAGYIYPTISLLALWEVYFFLEGIKRIEDECPDLITGASTAPKIITDDLKAIDEEVRKQFKDYYVCDVDISGGIRKDVTTSIHTSVTEYIAQAVESDKRNPQARKELYLDCLDKLAANDKSILINGNFFSEFSMYFLRFMSAVIARGDNVVFVCNSDSQIDSVYEYLNRGLSEISSLYCKGFNNDAIDFDDPIWRVVKVSGDHSVLEEASVDENNVLVTSLGYLCSPRFETEHSRFISLIDAVVFVDSLNTVNTFNRQLAIINTRLKHIIKKNSHAAKNGKPGDMFRVRYMSRNIRYICFDDTRTPGLDKVLKNMLSVELETADAMSYNDSTMVRCYRYEGKVHDNGRRRLAVGIDSKEEIGALMNVALLCLAKGASDVTVFTDDMIPYGNIAETLSSNKGSITAEVDVNRIRLNKRSYNPDEYSVIIAMDSGDNLPAALRRYISLISEKPALIIVFSRPYMLRDYYLSNIDYIWSNTQNERIPVEEGTKRDIAQRILVKANAGGVTKEEVIRLAEAVPQFKEYASKLDLNGILRGVLQVYGVSQEDRIDLFRYFEYTSLQDFDEYGKFSSEVRIVLRRHGKLFDMINGRDMVTMVSGDSEMTLPVPRSRLTQNYIEGQNLVFNGNIYHIKKIDVKTGKIYTHLAVGGLNDEAYRYVQSREYHLDVSEDKLEYASTKHVVLNRKEENIGVNDVFVSAFRAPMEVVTSGYYPIDPHTLAAHAGINEYHSINDPGNDMLAKQTYRRYGNVSAPFYSSDSVMQDTDLNAGEKGALVMSLRICGEFGSDVNKTMVLAAAMLNEIIHSMFPSVADSVAVCPVIHGEIAADGSEKILQKLPKVRFTGETELVSSTDLGLVIIEDCTTDLGVISVLMSSGDNLLRTLFNPVFTYLEWYLKDGDKSDYLYYGLDDEPECFDFISLHKLAKLLGDDKHDLKFVDLESVMEYAVCDFCGKKYAKGDDVIELDDGRKMCKVCAGNLVGNNKKVLKSHLDSAKIFLESTYGITLDDDYEFCFDSTVKIANTLKQSSDLIRRGADVPLRSYVDGKKKVHIEYSLPSVNLSELLVRELTHVWQLKHLPDLEEELAEGHIALVAIQYLRFLDQNSLASVRSTYYESSDNVSGEGYRKIVKALLDNPQFNNNPFRYLLSLTGEGSEDDIIPPAPKITDYSDLGLPYTPNTHDRAAEGSLKYFYYERLSDKVQKAYDIILNGVRDHEDKVIVDGCSFEEIHQASDSVMYDHPELFWYKTFSVLGSEVNLFYGASVEESASLQKRMDEVIPKYLEGIDDSMSAYDVALRLHTKVISSVDYDTIALNKQKEDGGPAKDKIDYLRTICGVFLNGKAVCEGYARAMQYLLQKCGVECAEIVGHIRKETGELGGAHAWNILKADGDYYYLDTTWDDGSNTVQTVKSLNLGFDYFCITTDELKRTRDVDLCPTDIPICNALRCNYFTHNNYDLDTYDLDRIKEIAQIAAKNKGRAFAFKCKSKALFEQAKSQLCSSGQDCYEVLRAAAKYDKQILSTTYSYTYNLNIRTITILFKYKQ